MIGHHTAQALFFSRARTARGHGAKKQGAETMHYDISAESEESVISTFISYLIEVYRDREFNHLTQLQRFSLLSPLEDARFGATQYPL